jgi:hypothetical protein
MAGPWLYCISSNGGEFFLKDRTIPVSLDAYGVLIQNGQITEDDWWGINQNWSRIERGDELLIYSGQKDIGIVGAAIITETRRSIDIPYNDPLRRRLSDCRAAVHLDFDLGRCRTLFADPIAAKVVRSWNYRERGQQKRLNLRRNVIDLAPVDRQLQQALSRHQVQPNEASLAIDGDGDMPNESLCSCDFNEPNATVEAMAYRIVRDTAVARRLKLIHENRCQICGTVICMSDGQKYSEAHHIRPLSRPHNGPDVPENILILCPNHHATCDFFGMLLDAHSLHRARGHHIGAEFIAYHNARVK